MPLTEKQAAFVASELSKRIESRRAVKAAAASAMEKVALRLNPEWFKGAYKWLKGMEQGAPRAARAFKGSPFGRLRASAAETLDRSGMRGLADRIAANGTTSSKGIPLSKAQQGYDLLSAEARAQLGLRGRDIVANAEKNRPGFLKRFWTDFRGNGLREFERKWYINPEDQLRAYRLGRQSLNDLRASYKNWARTRYGYMHPSHRTMLRDMGVNGGAMDRAIMSVPTSMGEIMNNVQKRQAYGDAVFREYYRQYQRMLKARGAVGKAALGAAGVGGIAYANQTAAQHARAAQQAQIPIDERGNTITETSDMYNEPYNNVNSALEWMNEMSNRPSPGASEADLSRGYNIR